MHLNWKALFLQGFVCCSPQGLHTLVGSLYYTRGTPHTFGIALLMRRDQCNDVMRWTEWISLFRKSTRLHKLLRIHGNKCCMIEAAVLYLEMNGIKPSWLPFIYVVSQLHSVHSVLKLHNGRGENLSKSTCWIKYVTYFCAMHSILRGQIRILV